MNTLLICLLGYKLTRSKILSVWIGAIFLLNSSLLRVSLYAMSEPLFLFLNFAAFLVYFLALEHPDRPVWLALVGLFSGLVILTRYSGLALIPTFSLMILVSRVEFKQKTRNLVLFLLPVILLVGMVCSQQTGGKFSY
jgi:4-amino-4-deoxy-L-arabinose transferase-like glycosyltransferase